MNDPFEPVWEASPQLATIRRYLAENVPAPAVAPMRDELLQMIEDEAVNRHV